MAKFGWCVLAAFGLLSGVVVEAAPPAATAAATSAPETRDNADATSDAEATDAEPGEPAQVFDLRYKFTPGETLRNEVVHQAKVQTTIQGTTQTAESQSTSIKVWKVDNVADDGTVTFSHMVENINMWQRTSGRQEVRYNSQTDQQVPPGYEQVAEAVGVPLSVVTMDPRGKILRRRESRQQPEGMSTQMTMPLPGEPVAVGTSWSSPLEIPVTLQDGATKKIKTRQRFTLVAVDDDLATIEVESQVLSPVSDPAIEAQLIQRMSQGHVKFDIEAGRVRSQQLDLDRRVIGFSGAASSMYYVTRFSERLLTDSEATARRQDGQAK